MKSIDYYIASIRCRCGRWMEKEQFPSSIKGIRIIYRCKTEKCFNLIELSEDKLKVGRLEPARL